MRRRRAWLLLALVATGIPAAVVWNLLAEPSLWRATAEGLVLTEENAGGTFQVVAVFTLIGAAVGVVWGVVIDRWGGPGHWTTVLAISLAALASALVCWQVGIVIGPSAPEKVAGLQPGDTVPMKLAVDTVVPFVVWPLSALLGYLVSFYFSADGEDDDDDDLWASDVTAGSAR